MIDNLQQPPPSRAGAAAPSIWRRFSSAKNCQASNLTAHA